MSLYDLSVETLSGERTTLGRVAGHRASLIVNVASRCGLTPQYEQLQSLHSSTEGLTVIGVPCNQFAEEEPGSPEEIAAFCTTNYGVTFPLLAKSYVRGRRQSPLFAALHASRGRVRRVRGCRMELREVASGGGRRTSGSLST